MQNTNLNMGSLTLPVTQKEATGSGVLQLSPIQVNEEYRKEWNVDLNDFVVLTKNGELVSTSLYRVGGLNHPKPATDEYFMLLKYVEAFYPERILKMSGAKDPKYLNGRWCILNKHGIEKVVFDAHKSPYLVRGSCLYSLDGNYYNIETGECYCYASSAMQSAEFLFLENEFDKDKSKRGVLKIHKKTGAWELFPGSRS